MSVNIKTANGWVKVAGNAKEPTVKDMFCYTDIEFTRHLLASENNPISYETYNFSIPDGYEVFSANLVVYSLPHVSLPCLSNLTSSGVGLTIFNTFTEIDVLGTIRVIFIKK